MGLASLQGLPTANVTVPGASCCNVMQETYSTLPNPISMSENYFNAKNILEPLVLKEQESAVEHTNLLKAPIHESRVFSVIQDVDTRTKTQASMSLLSQIGNFYFFL